MAKKQKNALAVTNRQLGQSILAEAEKKQSEDKGKHVIALVQELIMAKEHCLWWEETNRMGAEFYQKKIDAIRAGKFEISSINGHITFHDDALNQPHFRRNAAGAPPGYIPSKAFLKQEGQDHFILGESLNLR